MEEILARHEGKTLEFKENANSLLGIVKTVIAFANTAGGIIVVGIEDKTKKVIGLANPLEDETRIANSIMENIFPAIMPNIEIQSYREKALILIHVPYIPRPYYLNVKSSRIAYVRFGSTNREASEETLNTLKLLATNTSFDELICPKATQKDIDWNAVQKAFKKKEITPQEAKNLGLLDANNPSCATNGGILLFGENRSKFFPDTVIRCVKFAGETNGHSLDHRTIDSPPIKAIDDAILFIERNTYISSTIGRIHRIDVPQFPPVAVREAVINAIVHADYNIIGPEIIIAIFKDRIEITNPGGLPYGLTLENALAGATRIRNRVMMRVFHKLKIIEKWGSGLRKIIAACVDAGLKAPLFQDMNTHFRVTLYSEAEDEVKFEGWRQVLIKALKSKKKIKAQEAAALWEITPRTARRRLTTLVNEGLVVKIGLSKKDPYGAYAINTELFDGRR